MLQRFVELIVVFGAIVPIAACEGGAEASQERGSAPAADEPAAPAATWQELNQDSRLVRAEIELDRGDPLAEATSEVAGELGAGVFVRHGGTTELGDFLVARLTELDAHGIDPEPFPTGRIAELTKSAERWQDATANRRFLRSPSAEKVGGISADTLASDAARLGQTDTREADGELESLLMKSAVRYVAELDFVVRAHPDIQVTLEDVAEDHHDALVRRSVELLRGGTQAITTAAKRRRPYQALVDERKRYLKLAREASCPDLPDAWRFAASSTRDGPEVTKLQQRLACEGYFTGEPDGKFDERTIEAVKAYQRHHDIEETGSAMELTIRSMNVPMARRAADIGIALQRLREERKPEASYWIEVSLPAFEVRVWEEGRVTHRHRAIIGSNKLDDDKIDLVQGHINRTKLFDTELYEVVVNPDWILPERVQKGEVVGKLKENPNYLEDNDIVETTLPSGKKVMIQTAGKSNVLGKVKFLLKESSAIYLHDTNDRFLFTKFPRAFSHGCVRVDQAVTFAKRILLKDGWDEKEARRSLRAKSVQRGMKLNTPIPLSTTYITVGISDEGRAIFHNDVYGYDEAFRNGELPVEHTARWGHPTLRPRWVPKVDKKQVDAWRAAGKPAPRNLKPE